MHAEVDNITQDFFIFQQKSNILSVNQNERSRLTRAETACLDVKFFTFKRQNVACLRVSRSAYSRAALKSMLKQKHKREVNDLKLAKAKIERMGTERGSKY